MKAINDLLSQEEILCQLSEEAAELAQAALKLRRSLGSDNPTPVTTGEASDHLLEEIADVLSCIDQLFGIRWEEISRIRQEKAERWEARLNAAY